MSSWYRKHIHILKSCFKLLCKTKTWSTIHYIRRRFSNNSSTCKTAKI